MRLFLLAVAAASDVGPHAVDALGVVASREAAAAGCRALRVVLDRAAVHNRGGGRMEGFC
jgi:hypothetical protein